MYGYDAPMIAATITDARMAAGVSSPRGGGRATMTSESGLGLWSLTPME